MATENTVPDWGDIVSLCNRVLAPIALAALKGTLNVPPGLRDAVLHLEDVDTALRSPRRLFKLLQKVVDQAIPFTRSEAVTPFAQVLQCAEVEAGGRAQTEFSAPAVQEIIHVLAKYGHIDQKTAPSKSGKAQLRVVPALTAPAPATGVGGDTYASWRKGFPDIFTGPNTAQPEYRRRTDMYQYVNEIAEACRQLDVKAQQDFRRKQKANPRLRRDWSEHKRFRAWWLTLPSPGKYVLLRQVPPPPWDLEGVKRG